MTLSTNPTDLAREIRASNDKLLASKEVWSEMLATFHGRAWDQKGAKPEQQYQTHTYEYVSLMLPKLIHAAPQFSLSTTRGDRQAVLTRALERGLNHWARASRLQEPLEQLAVDALMLVGGAYVEEVPNEKMRLTREQREGMEGSLRRPKSIEGDAPEDPGQPYWPRVKRLDPFRWGWDMAASTEEAIRFWWHKVTEDKDDLMAKVKGDEGWRAKEISALATTTDANDLGYAHDNAPDRKQVTYYVIWVPDATIEGEKPESDQHGVIYTLACLDTEGGKVSGSFLRDPYYFYGPAQGPYVKAGFYTVPNATMPLSPLLATRDDADIVARVHKAMVRRVERYKRGAMFDLHDKRDIERIEDSQDMDLIGVTSFTGNLSQFELGGITAQDIEHFRFLLERLQTKSGMDDVARGNVTGAGTATEVAIASEGSQERVSFLVNKWRQFVADIGERVAWYAAHDDRVVFSYSVDEEEREQVASEALDAGMITPEGAESLIRYGTMTYAGGEFAEDETLLFGDLDFSVEPYSMQRRDQRTRKMDTLEALNVLSSFGAAAAQGVPINFGKIAEILADVYALPELESVVNRELAEQQGILSMAEREAAMEKDTATGPGAGSPQATPVRTERRSAPPKAADRQMAKGLM